MANNSWSKVDTALEEYRVTINMNAVQLMRQYHQRTFLFKPFSRKQSQVLTWWCNTSPAKNYNGIIADGSIRAGKTLSMALSFVFWGMSTFDGQFFAVCGKTIGSLRRNVIIGLKMMLVARGYTVKEKRSENLMIIGYGDTVNFFYLFGGRDESSQDLIQGITLAGVLFDEVALMPESFVNQATARCSVEGSKWWFNCNPQGPRHWFLTRWIKKCRTLELVYLHFTMDDNLSLSEEIKERYRKKYQGVFYQRYILGLWVLAEGSVYSVFNENKMDYFIDTSTPEGKKKLDYDTIQIGVDIGGNRSAYAFVATGIKNNYSKLTALMSRRYPAKGMNPEDLYRLLAEFVAMVEAKYGVVGSIYVDSNEQTLINGIRDRIFISIRNSIKNEIVERIRAATGMMGAGQFFYTDDCQTLEDALCSAVYNEKKWEDERLDDGTSDIDTLDAFEYSWERYIRQYSRRAA